MLENMLKGKDMGAYETYMMERVEEESKKSQMEREAISRILFSFLDNVFPKLIKFNQ